MATRELSLFADLDQGRLVQSYLSTLQAVLPRFVFGDAIPVSFRPLKSNGNNSVNPWREVDLTGKIVRIAIGSPAGAATSGTFTLSYGGDTTAAIAYNADGAAIQTALNALASITSAGGVVVTRAGTGAFRIVFNTAGTRTAITASTESLYPSSGAEIRVAVEGSVSAREIVVARLEALPAAFAELSDEMPVAACDVFEIRAGVAGVTGVDVAAASGVLDALGVGEGDTFTIGAVTFSLITPAVTENEIDPGANQAEKTANILAKINGHSTVLVTASAGTTADTVIVTAKTAGAAGNAIITPTFFTNETLVGGVDAVVAVTAVQATLSFRFSVFPYSGSYSLGIGGEQTLGIPWDADASTLQAALELLSPVGSGNVTVSGEFPEFTLNFNASLGDIGEMTIDMTGLIVPKGRVGLLDTDRAAMIELLNGASQAAAKLEIELYDIADDTTWTVLQTDCTVIDDVMGNTPSTSPAFPSVLSMIVPGGTAPLNDSITITGDAYAEGGFATHINWGVMRAQSVEFGKTNFGTSADYGTYATWDSEASKWNLSAHDEDGIQGDWYSTDDVSSPELVEVWIPRDAEHGSFTLTRADGTLSPPYIRVSGGFLYAQDSGVWKQIALSTIPS